MPSRWVRSLAPPRPENRCTQSPGALDPLREMGASAWVITTYCTAAAFAACDDGPIGWITFDCRSAMVCWQALPCPETPR